MTITVRGWSFGTEELREVGYNYPTARLVLKFETGRRVEVQMSERRAERYRKVIRKAWREAF